MVQPKYSPEEALQRVKLMMGYDTKKTLTENVESTGVNLSEQSNIWKDIAGGASVGAGAGAVFGGGVGAIPGAVIGGIYGLVVGMTSSSIREDNFKALVKACSTNTNELGKKTLDDATFDKLSDAIYTAVDGLGTDEDAIKSAFSQIPTVPDLCGLVDNYKETYGDLVSDLDGDLDGDTEWRDYVFLPLRPAIRASKAASEKTNDDKKKTGGGGTGGGTSYKPCTGTYQIGCMSDIIAKVQGCLKISADGKFGPKTQGALQTKFPNLANGFTDKDVETICDNKPKTGYEDYTSSETEDATPDANQNNTNSVNATNTANTTNNTTSNTKEVPEQ